jgi:hypothetical protein
MSDVYFSSSQSLIPFLVVFCLHGRDTTKEIELRKKLVAEKHLFLCFYHLFTLLFDSLRSFGFLPFGKNPKGKGLKVKVPKGKT